MAEAGSRKLMELEALRGVAAVIVLFIISAGVAPRLHGRISPTIDRDLRTPLFALVNGSAAWRSFRSFRLCADLPRHGKARLSKLLAGAAKRWPRLVPLVAIVNILSRCS